MYNHSVGGTLAYIVEKEDFDTAEPERRPEEVGTIKPARAALNLSLRTGCTCSTRNFSPAPSVLENGRTPLDMARWRSYEMNRTIGLAMSLGAAALLLISLACGDGATSSPTGQGTPTDPPPPAGQNVSFNELFATPDRYNGSEILLEGFYFHGWESNLLSERMEPSGFAKGHFWPQGQRLWVEGSIPTEVYEQLYQQQMMGPLERYGKVRIKGIFDYGETYGHGGGLDAQIVPSKVELLPWSPPINQQ